MLARVQDFGVLGQQDFTSWTLRRCLASSLRGPWEDRRRQRQGGSVKVIGLGNVGHRLASSLLRNDQSEAPGAEVVVRGRRQDR